MAGKRTPRDELKSFLKCFVLWLFKFTEVGLTIVSIIPSLKVVLYKGWIEKEYIKDFFRSLALRWQEENVVEKSFYFILKEESKIFNFEKQRNNSITQNKLLRDKFYNLINKNFLVQNL